MKDQVLGTKTYWKMKKLKKIAIVHEYVNEITELC